MNWATWQAELPLLFGVLLGSAAEPMPCDWADQPRRMHTSARAQLTIVSTPAVGVEDRRHHVQLDSEGAPTGELIEEAIGQRTMVLQVDVWSPRQSLDQSARARLETLRTRLAFDSTQRALKALRLSFQRAADPVRLDEIENNARVSRWAMDVTLAYAWSERDEDNVGTWIETGRITSGTDAGQTIEDEGGNEFPLQVDINPPEVS